MDLELLRTLAVVLPAVGGVITAVAGLVWAFRRRE
ncbi:MAG: hypothetical protein JWP92_759 [Caulobacter sp.]|nr:hypothetical protein [Caulobacter sp.]